MTIETLNKTKVGAPTRRNQLSIFPLSLVEDRNNGAQIAGESLVVTELAAATVPELQVHNPEKHPVLIPAGRVLEGGRQTRTVNVSILVPAGATMVIPVSCVEAGRWHGGGHFRDSKRMASRRVRIATNRGVKRNFDNYGRKTSDQGAVWDSVSHELSSRMLTSESSLYLSAYSSVEANAELRAFVNEMIEQGIEPGQTGIAIAHGDKIVGVELFTSESDLRSSWESLITSVVFDAEYADESAVSATIEDVEKFLAVVAAHESTRAEGTGIGTEVHIADDRLVAHALLDDSGTLMHAFAYAEA